MLFSIRTELLGQEPPTDSPPATSLIRLLLEAAANKAEAAEYGISTGFSIVRTARLSCDQIDGSIAEIRDLQDSSANDANAWNMLKKYWEDIQALEDLLLDEKGFFGTTDIKPTSKAVAECLVDIGKWETHRGGLKTELESLQGFLRKQKKDNSTPPATSDQQRDDATMMQSLISLLDGQTGLSQRAQTVVTALKTALSRINPTTHSQGIVPAIQGAWIVNAAAWESQHESDPTRKYYLSSSKAELILKHSFLTTINSGDASKFQEAYEALKAVLIGERPTLHSLNHSLIIAISAGVSVETLRCIELIKAAEGVRRPFALLNNLLVKYCTDLVELHNAAEHGRKVDNGAAIKEAIQKAKAAAVAAKASLPAATASSPATVASWELTDKATIDTAFNKAFDSLKELFKIYDNSKISTWDDVKTKASKDDVDRFDVLKTKWLANSSTPANPPGAKVTVTISNATGGSKAVTIHKTAKIDTLIWYGGGTFTGARMGNTQLTLGKTIGELQLGGKTIDLT